jgi:fructosamine-3-kinase
MTTAVHRKERAGAPPGLFAWEAAGLRWLEVDGGPRIVQVLAQDDDGLDLERISPAAPRPDVAERFGAALARLHDAGADAFGSSPPGWSGSGFFGPLDDPLPLPAGDDDRWGRFYADARLEQVRSLLRARHRLSPALARDLDRVADALRAGLWDDDDPPARLHGDLWAGNVLWTAQDAILIDPSAHGGHRLTDVAMLHLFGAPHLAAILAGYASVHPLPDGWTDLIELHQLYPLGMHAVLFGGSYVDRLAGLVSRCADAVPQG